MWTETTKQYPSVKEISSFHCGYTRNVLALLAYASISAETAQVISASFVK